MLLAIDEINRGNCAQIFGDMFQLLDRDAEGWSQYAIDLSDLHRAALETELERLGKTLADLPEKSPSRSTPRAFPASLRLPPQLSLIGTMNTSDESVYYMDTAFKRRWDFEHMPWQGAGTTRPCKRNGRAARRHPAPLGRLPIAPEQPHRRDLRRPQRG